MKIENAPLSGCLIITPTFYEDNRGYFFESFNKKKFEYLTGEKIDFVQDNQSFSRYGTVRGLHFQTGAYAQAKLIRVVEGEILDVVVDLRATSVTFGQYFSYKLNSENNQQLFVPKGFAHGYAVLSPTALVTYKCDQFYHKEAEGGIRFDDPTLNIDWKIPKNEMLLSDKDLELPYLNTITI